MARLMAAGGAALTALFGGLALALVLPRLVETGGRSRSQPVAARPAQAGRSTAASQATADPGFLAAAAAGVDPNQPLYVGASRRLAADAVDAIARSSLDAALVGLGQRFLGRPVKPLPTGSLPRERLVLDLTGFDNLSFVEQLLALANSRRVRTRTEAADRFSDHVRQLRYGGGRVDRCARLDQPSLWAVVAQRRGYLVDLTPYLPGRRQRRVPLRALLEDASAARSPAPAAVQPCRWPPGVPTLILSELPLEALPGALPSLRSGDLFVLRGSGADPFPDGIGLLEIRNGRMGALLLQPGLGVVRAADLSALARRWPGTRGVAFLRPLPNQDGRAEP